MSLDEAHKLMRSKYKVIRAALSLAFGFLSGYNSKNYRDMSDVIENIKEHYGEYAELLLKHANSTKVDAYYLNVLRTLAANTTQAHDLDLLINILFERTSNQ